MHSSLARESLFELTKMIILFKEEEVLDDFLNDILNVQFIRTKEAES